jgi:invasion protein IalB
MACLFALAPARPVRGALTALTAAAALALAAAQAPAQQPAQPAPKAQPRPQPKAAQPKAAPAAPAAPAPAAPPPAQTAEQMPQLIYSPWTKFCMKGQDPNAKQVCLTGKDARIESGMPVLAAVVIEPEGETKKLLRVTLPLGMSIQHGTRIIIDQGQPATGPYVVCFTNGCMSDYEASADMIGRLKKGQQLIVQAINAANGQPVSLPMPLGDFAKAYDGQPTDPKVFEEQQKKLQEELQRRADEARRKLEQGAPPAGKTQ